MSFFTLGKEGDNVVILTDAVEQCAGLTKLKLTREDAEELTRMLNFMLGAALAPQALPRVQDTERAPPPSLAKVLSPDAPVDDVILEAMRADKAALDARKKADEDKRERRRVALLGAAADGLLESDE